MSCPKIMDMIYEDSITILGHIQIWFHSLFCSSCAQEIEKHEIAKSIMREEFFPPSPNLEDSIMTKIAYEEDLVPHAVPGGLSTRGWVITGLIIFISLITVFFGLDFKSLVLESGSSFLLPVGITIGIVLTTYGAVFIGSHLEELSERFGL